MRPWSRRGACSPQSSVGLNSGLGIIAICPELRPLFHAGLFLFFLGEGLPLDSYVFFDGKEVWSEAMEIFRNQMALIKG